MIEPSTDLAPSSPSSAGKGNPAWPDDPIEMMNAMMREQSSALHAMFIDLKQHAGDALDAWPAESLAYFRLAFRAQANARSSMVAVARTELAVRRSRAESEK